MSWETTFYPVDKDGYNKVLLVSLLYEEFRSYWEGSREKTIKVFIDNNLFDFLLNNYDYYCSMDHRQIVKHACEYVGLSKGFWGFVSLENFSFITNVSHASSRIIYRLSWDSGIVYAQACAVFYASETYKKLSDRKTKLWMQRDEHIYEVLYRELNGLPVL